MKPEVKNEFQEVYQEIDGLKERIQKLEEFTQPAAIPHEDRIPLSEGHPIPEYNEKQCEVLFKAVFKNADKIRTAEMNLIDCVMDFLDFRSTYPKNTYCQDSELRAWGNQDYANYEAMKQAAADLSDL